MADIEVVIKIDEDIYNRFTHNEVRPRFEITEEERFQMDADAVRLTRAFCNGIPLPKGHGDLIDRGKLKTHFIGTEQGTDLEVYLEPTVMGAEAIIKADNVESEE